MNIKPQIYESLTPRQRVIASIEALARGDEEEKRRLVKSCPKKSYLQTDTAYSHNNSCGLTPTTNQLKCQYLTQEEYMRCGLTPTTNQLK